MCQDSVEKVIDDLRKRAEPSLIKGYLLLQKYRVTEHATQLVGDIKKLRSSKDKPE
jgi:hypothetical protein